MVSLSLFTLLLGCLMKRTEDMPLARAVLHVSHCRQGSAVLRIRGYNLGLRTSHPHALGGQALKSNVAGVMLEVHHERPKWRIL